MNMNNSYNNSYNNFNGMSYNYNSQNTFQNHNQIYVNNNYNAYPNANQQNVLQPLDWEFDNTNYNKSNVKQNNSNDPFDDFNFSNSNSKEKNSSTNKQNNDPFDDANFLTTSFKSKDKISIDKFKNSTGLSKQNALNNSFDDSNFTFDKPAATTLTKPTTLADWDDIETTLKDTSQNLIKTNSQTLVKKKSISKEETCKTKKTPQISSEINKPIRLKSIEPVESPKELKVDSLIYLKDGTPMLKYSPLCFIFLQFRYGNFGFPHFRLFRLSKDNLRIEWFSENKTLDESNVKVRSIEQLVMGQSTDIFLRAPGIRL